VATRLATQLIGQGGLGSDKRLLWTDTPTASQLVQAEQILCEAYVSATVKLRSNQSLLFALARTPRERQELTGVEVTAAVRPGQAADAAARTDGETRR